MVKPRMIIVIRHAQSEGNENRAIHQTVPDHRVKLTPHGWTQASEAGRRLRSLLKANDTLHFFTSPYRRTRETTEGILSSLTSDDESGPSPFPRDSIKVWEEPRLREQDFGNFQPCSAQMERMWQERADYGHFFYRIPNGESAADAYDRVSGFNETLWRSFGEEDFASVCVLVTHGLMTRIFLMKWYHWSVEYFEDLRNVNHCEFVLMQKHEETGKYMLQNNLRTWSELRRQKALEAAQSSSAAASTTTSKPASVVTSPAEKKQWGGCPEGCTHEHDPIPRRPQRKTTQDSNGIHSSIATDPPAPFANGRTKNIDLPITVSANGTTIRPTSEEDDEAFPQPSPPSNPSPIPSPTPSSGPAPTNSHPQTPFIHSPAAPPSPSAPEQSQKYKGKPDLSATGFSERLRLASEARPLPSYLEAGRDFGGSRSGANTPTYSATAAAAAQYGLPSSYVDDTPHGQPPAMGVPPAADYGFPSVDPATGKLKSPVRPVHARPAVASRLSREVGQSETDKIWPLHVRQDDLDDEAGDGASAAGVEYGEEAARAVGQKKLAEAEAAVADDEERRDRSLRGSVY